jgi:hypothetical protein
MNSFFALIVRLATPAEEDARGGHPAQQLLERAGARAGQNPRQARELRQAALAWMRVVR